MYKHFIMGVGKNLKKLRSRTKFSQQEIADMLDLDRKTYTCWENETTDIKSNYIPKLADIFQVSILDLFEAGNKDNGCDIPENFNIRDRTAARKGFQQGIVININDPETAKFIGSQLEELIRSLKKRSS